MSSSKEKETPEVSKISDEPKTISIQEADLNKRYHDVYTEHSPNHIVSHNREENVFHFFCENGFQLKISFRTPKVVRFHYSRTGAFEQNFSYAVIPLKEKKVIELELQEKESAFSIHSEDLTVKIQKSNLQLQIFNAQQQLLAEESAPQYVKTTLLKGTTDVKTTFKTKNEEVFFGLGDKATSLNIHGKSFENWNSDSFAYGEKSDPLYRSIPFYYSLHEGRAYGIFMDNSYRSFFDFNSKKDGLTTFTAKGGEMNYYFIYGAQLDEVARQYTKLTGTPEMPPLWALGFHQCRWSYKPEQRVRELAQTFRDKKIPCDSIYLDIDYMDGYRCFTWNNKLFPDPKQMITDLEKQGFKTVVMIDPGIKVDEHYSVYKEGKEKNYFCRRTNGEVMYGPVWPPVCVWPDFTATDVRAWWGQLYKELYTEDGVSGFWNDMNEPAVFQIKRLTFPDEVKHDYDGNPTTHAKAHNIYGLTMSKASQEGLKKLNSHKRPFLLTRATFSGGQRYGALWTGDNVATWEHLEIANRQCQRLSVSGFSFVGTDIGGFAEEPTGELMVRWVQLGVFHPFYRIHYSGNNLDGAAAVQEDVIENLEAETLKEQEPWSYGEKYTQHTRAAIELRYRLLPYIYTTFRRHIMRGLPIMRHLAFYDQTDKKAIANENGFLFGEHLIVYPVTKEHAKQVEVYLPKGNWFDYFSGKRYKGHRSYKYPVTLEHSPIFVKAGSVIPNYPVQQYTNEKPIDVLTLRAYVGRELVHNELYEDSGDGYSFLNGDYKLRSFYSDGREGVFNIKQIKEGKRKTDYSTIELQIFGLDNNLKNVYADGQNIAFSKENQYYIVSIVPDFEKVEIKY